MIEINWRREILATRLPARVLALHDARIRASAIQRGRLLPQDEAA